MKKSYCHLDLRFHHENNKHSQVSDVMKNINKANEELENKLRHNYVIKED